MSPHVVTFVEMFLILSCDKTLIYTLLLFGKYKNMSLYTDKFCSLWILIWYSFVLACVRCCKHKPITGLWLVLSFRLDGLTGLWVWFSCCSGLKMRFPYTQFHQSFYQVRIFGCVFCCCKMIKWYSPGVQNFQAPGCADS